MAGGFTRKLLSLTFIVAGLVAAQSAPPAPAQTTPRPVQSIPAIAKAANGAIVTIVMMTDDKPLALGTGFIVSSDGVIVTNYHVIKNGNVAVVKFPDGTALPVDGVLAADKVRDLALIKIHGKTFHALPLGNSDRIQIGEAVVDIGNPLGLELTVSNGILSGVRTIEKEGGKFLQTTAPISHGSSGGPLFNMLGDVIGVNEMYLEGGENLNFAIPVNDAKRLLLNRSATLQNLPNEVEPEEASKETPVQDAAQQKACDEQVPKFYRYFFSGKAGDYRVPLTSGYAYHYDVSANKCYVGITIMFGNGKDVVVDKTRTLPVTPYDPPEARHFRFQGWLYRIYDALFEGDGGPIYGEFSPPPSGFCHIFPLGDKGPTSPKIECRSEEEFNDLASKYFGVAPPSVSTFLAHVPPNAKLAALPPDPTTAAPEQFWEEFWQDAKYCYQNPANNLQLSNGSLVGCWEVNATRETRETECQSKTDPGSQNCTYFLQNDKALKAGRL